MKNFDFYPHIEPYNSFMLQVDKIHNIYVEECGNPNGKTIIFLHGGPGAGCGKKARRFFDPKFYHIILFDQRGCGRSEPFLSLENNNIFELVEDMEKIRKYLNIEKWILFGGSFGGLLALMYALKYKENVESMILQGTFLSRQEDIDWFFKDDGLAKIYPDEFKILKNHIPLQEQNNLIEAYYKRFFSDNLSIRDKAAKIWSNFELRVMESDNIIDTSEKVEKHDLSLALIEAHYFHNKMEWEDDNYILNRINKIKNIPCYVVHGRFDVNSRLSSSYELAEKFENCKFIIVEGTGHSPFTKKMSNVLINILENIKKEDKNNGR